MAKVILQRAWAIGGEVYRPINNPVTVPDKYLERLPSTAKVLKDEEAKLLEKGKAKPTPKALSQLKQDEILPKG